MNSLLIVGFREKDAGKTMVAQAILRYLKEQNINVCGFKPKAGNSLWYDYDIVHEALSQGRLYGKDAKLLRKASETNFPEEIISPIHRLWIETFPYPYINKLPTFLVDRITVQENNMKHLITVNKPLLNQNTECEKLLTKLFDNAEEIINIYSLGDLNKVVKKYYDEAIRLAYEKIQRNHEFVVVESYGNVALPWDKIENLKIVLGVEPWFIRLYDPNRYLTTVKLTSQLRIDVEITTSQIQHLLKPVKEIKIVPSRSSEIVEDLKRNVGELLEI
ncbi:hypothetical protein DRO26_00605 [Candidatus Bathyarchaeota archaeon]|nr:MAG: hypothetical protein DRO26_00605 [Candidatus Bathyarchaeota archaeon]